MADNDILIDASRTADVKTIRERQTAGRAEGFDWAQKTALGHLYAPDKSICHRQQKVKTCRNFLNEIDIPDIEGTAVYHPPKEKKTARPFGHTVLKRVHRINSSLPL